MADKTPDQKADYVYRGMLLLMGDPDFPEVPGEIKVLHTEINAVEKIVDDHLKSNGSVRAQKTLRGEAKKWGIPTGVASVIVAVIISLYESFKRGN